MIYEPAEDSYLLQKEVRKFAIGRVLDVGCGSGIQGMTALGTADSVLLVDINEECVDYCKKKGLDAVQSDLFENVKGKFDLIIFNPPYLPKDSREDEESALSTTGGEKGNEVLIKFLKEVRTYLEEDGKVLIVVSSLTPDVEKLIKERSFKFKVLSQEKVDFEMLSVYIIHK
tara:strand:- start:683 stop:1198 length:516 start_codon:yes stop_codon:yes gene_type:complete